MFLSFVWWSWQTCLGTEFDVLEIHLIPISCFCTTVPPRMASDPKNAHPSTRRITWVEPEGNVPTEKHNCPLVPPSHLRLLALCAPFCLLWRLPASTGKGMEHTKLQQCTLPSTENLEVTSYDMTWYNDTMTITQSLPWTPGWYILLLASIHDFHRHIPWLENILLPWGELQLLLNLSWMQRRPAILCAQTLVRIGPLVTFLKKDLSLFNFTALMQPCPGQWGTEGLSSVKWTVPGKECNVCLNLSYFRIN